MKIYCYQPPEGGTNFGDELNQWMWPRLIPSLKDSQSNTFVFAIGTVLNKDLEALTQGYERVIVFGSGYGYGELPTGINNWDVAFVRGPITAEKIGASHITDPGALIATLIDRTPSGVGEVGYMPHFRWGFLNDWLRAAQNTKLKIIDPRWSIERVVDEMCGVRLMLCEAMHGAITSDALRIPWIPVVGPGDINQLKWRDWCASMSLDYRPIRLNSIWTKLPRQYGIKSRALKYVFGTPAVAELLDIAERSSPVLSDSLVFSKKISELEEKVRWLEAEI